MARFTNKVALVTGATSGIGEATALAFAKEGAKVVVAGRRQAEGEKVVKQIQDAGGEAIFVATDVSKAGDYANLVAQAKAAYGKLDTVFLNAGVAQFAPLLDSTEEQWDLQIDANLKGAWLGLKHTIPALLESGGGSIVLNGTIGAEIGFPNASIYTASKGGVVALARTAALEFAKQGVRINVVNPGAVGTEMTDSAFGSRENAEAAMGPGHPIGRIGYPEEIASAVLYLSSDEASFVTGQALNVDGGYTTA